MAKKSKVSVDDFAFVDEEELQPLNIIVKSIQKTDAIHESKVNKDESQLIDKHSISETKSDNKKITKGYQTDNNSQKEQITIGQQTDNKRVTKLSIKSETDNKRVTKRITEQITIGQQTDNKRITKCGFESLVGNEKNLLLLIFKECLRIGSLISPEITLSHINESLEISSGVAKMVIHRLVKKDVIKRENSKTGRGGWIKFSIQKELYQDLRIRESDNKEITNGYQSDNKRVTKRVTEQITKSPYSSSNDLNNITTNTGGANISAELCLPINLARFGISQNNLQKLIDEGLCNFEVVQKSVDALSFDVDQGKTGNLASILFGVLRSGKEYVSQKQAEELSKELEFELNRLKDIEDNHQKLLETRLKARYQEFLENTPNHLSEIKKRHHGLLSDNSDLLDKLAFEDFKTHLNQNIENQ